jgi:O-antigen/teichoic acid export membrane protein
MSGLVAQAKGAALWGMGYSFVRDVLQFSVMLYLVRLLGPKEYGEFALTTSVLAFATWVSFTSFVAHAIQVQEHDTAKLKQHFAFGARLQLAAFAIFNFLAFCASFTERFRDVSVFLHLMSIALILTWPTEFQRVRLTLQSRWKRMAILNLVGLISGLTASVALALAGAGVYALFAPAVIVYLPYVVDLFFIEKWPMTWNWSRQSYRSTLGFAMPRIASGAVIGGRIMIESSVIWSTLGANELGVFSRSVALAQLLCSKVGTELLGSIYPVLVRSTHMSDGGAKANSILFSAVCWFTVPMVFFFGTIAKPLIDLLLGSKWEQVSDLFPFVLTLSLAVALLSVCSHVVLSRGKPRLCFWIDLWLLGGTIAALAIGVKHGLSIYIVLVIVVYAIAIAFCVFWLNRNKLLLLNSFFDAFLIPTIASAIAVASMLVGVTLLFEAERNTVLGKIVFLAVSTMSFGLTYLVVLRFVFASRLTEFVRYVPWGDRIKRALFLK